MGAAGERVASGVFDSPVGAKTTSNDATAEGSTDTFEETGDGDHLSSECVRSALALTNMSALSHELACSDHTPSRCPLTSIE